MSHRKSLISLLVLLCLMLLTLAGCSKAKELAPALVLEEAYAATQEVTSFHFTWLGAVTTEGIKETEVFEADVDYLAPDRMHMRAIQGEDLGEQIIIGSKIYDRKSESSPWSVREFPQDMPSLATQFGSMVDPHKTLELLNSPGENVVQLPDETIGGVKCWHYRIATDFDLKRPLIERMEEEADPVSREMLQVQIDYLEAIDMTQTAEIWIGKNDYLMRQSKNAMSQNAVDSQEIDGITVPEGTRFTVTMTMKLSDFNKQVEIEAPAGAVETGPSLSPGPPTPTTLPKP